MFLALDSQMWWHKCVAWAPKRTLWRIRTHEMYWNCNRDGGGLQNKKDVNAAERFVYEDAQAFTTETTLTQAPKTQSLPYSSENNR
jgi:hypothetical protein